MNLEPSLVRRTTQIALAGFLFLLFCSLSTTVAFTLGRLKGAQAVDRPKEKPVLPLIIDPAGPPAAAGPGIAAPPPAVVQVTVAPVPAPLPTLYYQVGSLEKGMAEACKQYLEKNAFSAKITQGTEPGVSRVLVGPVEPAAVDKTRAGLESLGFRVFLRRL